MDLSLSASASSGAVSTQRSNFSITFSSVLPEGRDRNKRKLNLISHKVPESSDTNSDVRKQHDTDMAEAVFNQHLGIATTVSNARRLRKKGNKSRLNILPVLYHPTMERRRGAARMPPNHPRASIYIIGQPCASLLGGWTCLKHYKEVQ